MPEKAQINFSRFVWQILQRINDQVQAGCFIRLVPGLFLFGRAGVGSKSTRWRKARLQRPLTRSTLVLLTKQKGGGKVLSVSSMQQTRNLVSSTRGTKSHLLSKHGRRRSSWRERPFRPQTGCHRNHGSLWFVVTWWTLFLGNNITIHKLRILRRFLKNSTPVYRSFAFVETTTWEIHQHKNHCKSTGTISAMTSILFGLEVSFWASLGDVLCDNFNYIFIPSAKIRCYVSCPLKVSLSSIVFNRIFKSISLQSPQKVYFGLCGRSLQEII